MIAFNAAPQWKSPAFYEASQFPLIGKISDATETRYERLPAALKSALRTPVWNLGKNTSGLAVRFCSNSTAIFAKWEALNNSLLANMTPAGTKGLDLYCFDDGQWRFVNCAQPYSPDGGKKYFAPIVTGMLPQEREYMLYLPLYDGIVSLEIGIDSAAYIAQPRFDLPERENPVVCYGTSILQGGHASRPGMSLTNILSRRFNRVFINLGFSGEAHLDYEIAELMASTDASLYLLDFVSNATVDEMNERAEKFFYIIRNKRPETPVIFVEDPIFTHSRYDRRIAKEVSDKNETIGKIFKNLEQKSEKNIYFLSSKEMLGSDGEATVDGIHFTDLGFVRYENLIVPLLEKLLKPVEIKPLTQTIGDYRLTLLPERMGEGNPKILIDASPEILSEYLPDGTWASAVNAFLLRTSDKNILIDAGLGRALQSNLASAGLNPEQINIILLTHMHGDHIGGLLADGKKVFPNADLYIAKAEYDYWIKSDNKLALNVLSAYKDRLKLFIPSEISTKKKELFAGVSAVAAYGHTPGHTAYLIESQSSKLLIWGDLTHVTPVQFPHPEIAVTYDVEPSKAIESRKQIMEFAAKNNIPIAGMHIAFPAMGTLKKEGRGGYVLNPL
jgi:glyoxylase-like metal-dependent hydrolase (beta-lactamase superfamily II)